VLCVLVCGKEFTGQIRYSVVKSALCVGLWEDIHWTDMVQCGEKCCVCWSVKGIHWTDMVQCGEKCFVCLSVGRHLLDRSA